MCCVQSLHWQSNWNKNLVFKSVFNWNSCLTIEVKVKHVFNKSINNSNLVIVVNNWVEINFESWKFETYCICFNMFLESLTLHIISSPVMTHDPPDLGWILQKVARPSQLKFHIFGFYEKSQSKSQKYDYDWLTTEKWSRKAIVSQSHDYCLLSNVVNVKNTQTFATSLMQ